MAGDWVKIQHATPDKPEIYRLAEILNIDPDAALGKCLRLWIWADQQSIDGNALSVTLSTLDRFTRATGFADAMQKVGWLRVDEGVISFPRFDRHNGKTAKKRAQTANRVDKTRNAPSVTEALPEKRREEKNNSLGNKTPKPRFQKPTLPEVEAYIRAKGYGVDPLAWMAHYESNGWRVGKNPMSNWKAAVVTWQKNLPNYGNGKPLSSVETLRA